MLYQTILEQGGDQRLLADHSQLVHTIDRAGRFVFDELASRTMAQLALTRPSRILMAKQFLQLPFDPLWVEYRDAERKNLWRQRGGEINEAQHQPSTTGLLLWKDKEDPTTIHLWNAWDLTQAPDDPLAEPFHFSPLSVSLDLSFERADEERVQATLNEIYQRSEFTFAKSSHLYLIRNQPEEVEAYARILSNAEVETCPLIGEDTVARMVMVMGAAVSEAGVRFLMDRWREDVTQEIPFVIASLLLLNCRNGVSQEQVDYEKLNKKRVKRGKTPIREHTVIRLRVPRGAMGTGSRSYERRSSHWVMGHPKVRKTGVFWWSPHIRGEGGEGAAAPRTRLVKG